MKRERSPLVEVLELVLHPDSPFSSPERIVAVAIAKRFGGKDRAWPSLTTLVGDTGLSQTAVRAALDRLCEGEEAIFDRVRGGSDPGGRRRPTEFVFRGADRITRRQGHVATVSPGGADPITTRMHEQLNGTAQRTTPPLTPPLPRGGRIAGAIAPRGARRYEAAIDALADLVRPYGVVTNRHWRRRVADELVGGADVEQLVDRHRRQHEQAESAYAAGDKIGVLVERFGGFRQMAAAACDYIQEVRETHGYREAKRGWAKAIGLDDDVGLWIALRGHLEDEERRRGIRERENARDRAEFQQFREKLLRREA